VTFSDTLIFFQFEFFVMPKADIPESLRAQLKEQGYSVDVIKELWNWYDFSEKKGVASY
jgi:hypothetical protein